MVAYEGFATMYMRTCMSKAFLPVNGTCKVEGKKVDLDFHFTGFEFDLPTVPMEAMNDFDFKIRGETGVMTLTVGWSLILRSFTGVGKMEDGSTVLTFTFYTPKSSLRFLPEVPFHDA